MDWPVHNQEGGVMERLPRGRVVVFALPLQDFSEEGSVPSFAADFVCE